jgi:hypothetical protein
MASRVFGPAALLVPSLLAQAARLHADLETVIERSRDLCWWARQLRAGSASPARRAIRGGASVGDAALLMTLITGVPLCQACISHRSGIPASRVDDLLKNVRASIALCVTTRPCAACLETRRTYCLDGAAAAGTREATLPNGTQHAILNLLGQQPGSAFCSDCIAAKVFTGKKNIDVAMRLLEGNGMYRRHDRCSACGKSRLVASLPSPN